jgi:hypothetical protein
MDYISYTQLVQMNNVRFLWEEIHQNYESVETLLAYLLNFSEYNAQCPFLGQDMTKHLFVQRGSASLQYTDGLLQVFQASL